MAVASPAFAEAALQLGALELVLGALGAHGENEGVAQQSGLALQSLLPALTNVYLAMAASDALPLVLINLKRHGGSCGAAEALMGALASLAANAQAGGSCNT